MKTIIKKAIHRIGKPMMDRYLASDRDYKHEDISVTVRPGVFHPGFFFSTRIMLFFLSKLDLPGKRLLELGAGSGLLSIYAAKQGAKVTSSDISKTAAEGLVRNGWKNNVELTVYESDLFNEFPPQTFDIIIINPPFYPHNPVKESQYAWFCGKGHVYFRRLFPEMLAFLNRDSQIYMILSEDCDIAQIRQLARSHGYSMEAVFTSKNWWETNFVFSIRRYQIA